MCPNPHHCCFALKMLEAFAGRTLTGKSLLVRSPKEPEYTQQDTSCLHCRVKEKEVTNEFCRRGRGYCMVRGRGRTLSRVVEASVYVAIVSSDSVHGHD